MRRRDFGKGMAGATLLSILPGTRALAENTLTTTDDNSPINVILSKNYDPPVSTNAANFSFKLTRATLDFLDVSFSGRKMPIWQQKYEEIDFEKRVQNVVYWIMKGIVQFKHVYPVDPIWIIAQIMHESYFCEFSVSKSLAVGICQFVTPTAHEYDMLCAGDRPEHSSLPYLLPELAAKEKEYYALRRQKRNYARANKPNPGLSFEKLVELVAAGRGNEVQADAQNFIAYNKALEEFDDKIRQARDAYITYLKTNLDGKDIFDDNDLRFLLAFDERVTYKKPIFGMIQMLARGLKARNGNIIAAAAGYNAGLSRTIAQGIYKPYGKIPHFEETITYLSRVFILHHEISKRLA